MISERSAKKILEEQRRKRRERQAEYINKLRESGHKRIAVMITVEAFNALDKATRASEKTKGAILSEIILDALEPVRTDSVNVPRGTYDKEYVLTRVREMHKAGLSDTQIAEKLTAEGIPTKLGKDRWHRATITRIVERIKKEAQKNG